MRISRIRSLVGVFAIWAALGSAPAWAARIYVRVAPPPPIVEVRPPAPGRTHVWIGGYHRWNGSAYVWAPGRWELPPRPHGRWVPGHWSHHHQYGHYWVEGHWR